MESKKIVVIGSGLGGLTSAVILANAGFAVTLFERQKKLGGYAIQFRRKEYIFDPALHAVPAGGVDQAFSNLLKEIGIEKKVLFVKLPAGPRVILGGKHYLLPNTQEQLFAYLSECFPAEKENLMRFRKYLDSYAKVYSGILLDRKPLYRSLPPFLIRIPAFLYQSYESTDKFLGSFFNDTKLKALLYQYAIFMGIPTDEFPAVNYIMMASLMMSKGMYSIAGGGGGLSQSLADYFRELGGTIITETEIASLVIKNGKAVGVMDQKGKAWDADIVIANTSVRNLLEMTPSEYIPKRYLKTFGELKPSISVVQLHLGLDCSVKDLGIDRHLLFYFPQEDIDKNIKSQQNALFPEGFSITAPGIVDSSMGSQYDRVLSIVGGVSGERWMALDDNEYRNAKVDCQLHILKKLSELYPDIERHIVVTDLATPRTFYRYTGNPLGALMGFNCTCGTHKKLMQISKFPIKNIFISGAWTDKLGGFMMSMKAGQRAAEQALKLVTNR